jgi:hypothetical protein
MESLMDGMEKDLEDIYLKKQEALAIQLKKTKTNSPQREQLLKQGGAYDALIDKIRLITHD